MKKVVLFSDSSIFIRISGPRDPEEDLDTCAEDEEEQGCPGAD
jgi:hypothetical protein